MVYKSTPKKIEEKDNFTEVVPSPIMIVTSAPPQVDIRIALQVNYKSNKLGTYYTIVNVTAQHIYLCNKEGKKKRVARSTHAINLNKYRKNPASAGLILH